MPLRACLILSMLFHVLVLAAPAEAARRDQVGPRSASPSEAREPASRAGRTGRAALVVNGVENGIALDARSVRRALREGQRSWLRLRELHSEEKLLEAEQTKSEFIVLNELAIPLVVRNLFREQDEANRMRMEEAWRRARSGENWERLVALYATEPGAGLTGDVGVVAYDNLVAPFNRVMFDAPIGVVQKPVQTMFGWHVGKVVEVMPPRDIPRADGTTVRRPETRRVQQMLLVWNTGALEDGRTTDLRMELRDLVEQVTVEVVDPAWCAEFPNWCERRSITAKPAAP